MPDSHRLSAHEIYEEVEASGRSELDRPPEALAFSGLGAGLLMGLTGLGVAGTRVLLHGEPGEFVSMLLYPLGFIAVVIGRSQLFTENTLFPVVLVLKDHRHLLVTLRLWAVVLAANVAGSVVFAAFVTRTGALHPAAVDALVALGTEAVAPSTVHVFTSAIVGGWLVAMMAWLVSGAQQTIAQVLVIWLMTFPVGLLHLAHCVASSGYILAAAFHGSVGAGEYVAWLATATAGNIVGGVLIVALLNHAQVHAGEE